MANILILYKRDGSLNSIAGKEFIWQRVLTEHGHLDVDRAITVRDEKMIKFSDGTIVECLPFLENIKGKKAKEIYITPELLEYKDIFSIMVTPKGNYSTSIFVYEAKNNKVSVETIDKFNK